MSDEDILKTVADELRRFGDFDNIDYLIPNLGQAIENILAKYDRALSDLVKADKEKNELKEKYYYEKNRTRNELDTVYIKARYDERDKWKSTIKDTIEELKENGYWNYLEERDLETTVDILEKLIEKEK